MHMHYAIRGHSHWRRQCGKRGCHSNSELTPLGSSWLIAVVSILVVRGKQLSMQALLFSQKAFPSMAQGITGKARGRNHIGYPCGCSSCCDSLPVAWHVINKPCPCISFVLCADTGFNNILGVVTNCWAYVAILVHMVPR